MAPFDATARIRVDLSGFRTAVAEVTSSSRAMASATGALDLALKGLDATLRAVGRGGTSAARGILKVQEAANPVSASLRAVQESAARMGQNFNVSAQASSRVASALRQQTTATDATAAADRRLAEAMREEERASRTAAAALNEHITRTRDLGQVYGQIAQQAAKVVSAFGFTVSAAVQQEKAFADVRRVTGLTRDEARFLEQGLLDLAAVVPIPFTELAEIATIGGQLGIASKDLQSFTDTVARYSAATGISAEQSAIFFGRLSVFTNVAASDYKALGSMVARLGVTMIATDEQVQRTMESITAVGAQAGFTTQEIGALGATMASLGVSPYLARGAFLRLLNDITKASTEGGDKLAVMAKVLGMTGQEVQKLQASDPSALFYKLVDALGRTADAGTDLQPILRAMGVTNSNDLIVIQRLAGGHEVLAKALITANGAYAQANELGRQSAITFGTVSAKATTVMNAFKGVAAAIVMPALPLLSQGLELVASALNKVRNSPVLAFFVTFAAAITGAVAAFTAYKSALAAVIVAQALTARSTQALGVGQLTLTNLFRTTRAMATGNAAAMTATAASTAAAGAAATGASVGFFTLQRAMGVIGIGLTLLSALWVSYKAASAASVDSTKAATDAAWGAVGGHEALAGAVAQDTAAMDRGETALKAYTSTSDTLTGKTKDVIEAERAKAQAVIDSSVAFYGSEAALRDQAKAQGMSGDAARASLKDYEAATATLSRLADQADGVTLAYGKQTAALIQAALKQALFDSDIAKSADSMGRAKDAGLDLVKVNTLLAQGRVDEAMNLLSGALDKAEARFKATSKAAEEAQNKLTGMKNSKFVDASQIETQQKLVDSLNATNDGAKSTRDGLKTLFDTVNKGDTDIQELANIGSLLGENLDKTGDKAKKAAGSIDEFGDVVDNTTVSGKALAETMDSLAGPSAAWAKATEIAGDKAKGTADKLDEATVSLNDYMSAIDKVLQANRDFATNLVELQAKMPTDLAGELAKQTPQTLALMNSASRPELDKFAAYLRLTSETGAKSFAEQFDRVGPLIAGKGVAIGQGFASAYGGELKRAAEGGSVSEGVNRVRVAVELLNLVKANPKISLDDAPAKATTEELIAYLAGKVAGGELSPEGKAALARGDFDAVLAAVAAAAKAADVSPKGNVVITKEDADRELRGFQNKITEMNQSNAIGPKGQVVFSGVQQYHNDLTGMSGSARSMTNSGSFNVHGLAQIATGDYFGALRSMASEAWIKRGDIINALSGIHPVISFSFRALNSVWDFITGQATGGWVRGPGGPRDDRIPTMLSNGEYVVNAASARKYSALLEAINAQQGRGPDPLSSLTSPPRADWGKPVEKLNMSRLVGAVGRIPQQSAPSAPSGPKTVITVNNTYPQAEPTSVTINRSLALAATLSGV
ncbi:phage tail tape measure protein [Streptomyces sp. NPDC059835]|uniref:phage tail tape measure protein n=1 Tax=Streptomyces sp. NPDC059835 TaxID=3346967 RepID=UPI0036689086